MTAPVFETTYKINGVDIPFPATGHWMDRRALGLDGNNRTIYSPVRSFELTWVYMTVQEFRDLYAWWESQMASGFVNVTLPTWPGADDFENFTTYTGCVLDEPKVGEYYQRTYSSVQMLIRNIVT